MDTEQQFDLSVDGGDALLIHEIVTGLVSRDVGRAEKGLVRLAQEHASHPDLVALTALIEARTAPVATAATHVAPTERIELTERRLAPAVRRFLGTVSMRTTASTTSEPRQQPTQSTLRHRSS